jgi:hypothetical protein
LRDIFTPWFAASPVKITQAVSDGLLIEVPYGNENKENPGKKE